MMTFRSVLPHFRLPMSKVWLLSDIAEAKGRQELFTKQSPQLLKALREMAIIQSVESSNRIEGVTVEPLRLRPLVLGNARPKDRSEEEIQGYRNALQRIHSDAASLPIKPDNFIELHRTIQDGAGDAGQWKSVDNDIIELHEGRPPLVRFRPVSVAATPVAVHELCILYRHALDQQHFPALIAVAALILDFLCVHPFRDGNGRVSRLLTLLMLYHHGFEVGRFISLERLIEESKEDYYAVLQSSSNGWHEGKHDLLPWLNYFLAIVRRAYVQFEERAGEVKSPRGAKSDLVHTAILAASSPFRIAELHKVCPGVSVDWIRSVLKDLRSKGKVECLGRGQQAQWRRLSDELGST